MPATTNSLSLPASKAGISAPLALLAPAMRVKKPTSLSVIDTVWLVVPPSTMPALGLEMLSCAVSSGSASLSSLTVKVTKPLVWPSAMVIWLLDSA